MDKIQETVAILRRDAFDFFVAVRRIYADYLIDVPVSAVVQLAPIKIAFDTFYNGRDERHIYRAASFHEFLVFVFEYVGWEFENRLDRNDYNIVWEPDEDFLGPVRLNDDFATEGLRIAEQVAEFIADQVTFAHNVKELRENLKSIDSWRPDFGFETLAQKIFFSVD